MAGHTNLIIALQRTANDRAAAANSNGHEPAVAVAAANKQRQENAPAEKRLSDLREPKVQVEKPNCSWMFE